MLQIDSDFTRSASKHIKRNAGLKAVITETVTDAYDIARIEAAGELDVGETMPPSDSGAIDTDLIVFCTAT